MVLFLQYRGRFVLVGLRIRMIAASFRLQGDDMLPGVTEDFSVGVFNIELKCI